MSSRTRNGGSGPRGRARAAGRAARTWWSADPVAGCAELLIGLLLVVLTFISTDQAIASDRAYPMLLVVMGVAGAACLVLAVVRGRESGRHGGTGRQGRRSLGLIALPFLAMLCWAGITIPMTTHVALTTRYGPLEHIRLPMASMVVPLVEAALTALVAVGLVALIGRDRLPGALWRVFLVLAASTLIAIAWEIVTRQAFVRRAVDGMLMWRTSTQLGGQATYHLALLLGIGVAVDAIRRRRLVGASWFVIVALGLAIGLSGSRAGLICLGLFCVLLFFWGRSAGRPAGSRRVRILGALGLAALAVIGLVVVWLRGGGLVDHDRAETWKVAWRAVSVDPSTIIMGRGYATLWPWFAIESGIVPGAIHGLRRGPYGKSLAHAHNTIVQVTGELGVVGLVLLMVCLVTVVACCLRGFRGRYAGTCMALLASCPALLLDTYLVKNFQVSFVWWLVAAAVAVLMARPGDDTSLEPPEADRPGRP